MIVEKSRKMHPSTEEVFGENSKFSTENQITGDGRSIYEDIFGENIVEFSPKICEEKSSRSVFFKDIFGENLVEFSPKIPAISGVLYKEEGGEN